MAKNVIIRKYRDKIEIRDRAGKLLVDVLVAKSSKTCSVNLGIQAADNLSIRRVPQIHWKAPDEERAKARINRRAAI